MSCANRTCGPAGTIAEYGYAYDAAGDITGIADAIDAGYDRTFAYDDLNRLVTANTGPALWRTGTYTYDAMGNMLSSKLGDPELSIRIDEAYFTYVGTTPRIATVRRTPLPPRAQAHARSAPPPPAPRRRRQPSRPEVVARSCSAAQRDRQRLHRPAALTIAPRGTS